MVVTNQRLANGRTNPVSTAQLTYNLLILFQNSPTLILRCHNAQRAALLPASRTPRHVCSSGRLRLKCDDTRTETRFRLSAKRTSPFKSAGASVQSTAGSRGVRISGSNAGYTMFRGSVKSTGCPLHSHVSPSLPPPVRHLVPSHFNWTLPPVGGPIVAQDIWSLS